MDQSDSSTAPMARCLEDRWLLTAVQGVLLGGSMDAPLSSEGVDWKFLRQQASLHALGPCLAQYCESRGDAVPPTAKAELQQELADVRAYNFFLLQELTRVTGLLEAAGVRVLAWKGPALAVIAYQDAGLRQCADLDLLVCPAQAEAAVAVMVNSGYREQAVETGGHTRNLERAIPKVVVEVHQMVAQPYFSVPLSVETLLADAVRAPSLTGSVPVPAPENLLLLLCVHGSKHVWDRLIWICDVVLLLRTHPQLSWERVWQTAANCRAERMLALGLLLAEGLAPGCVPEVVRERCRRDKVAIRLAARACEWLFMPRHSYYHGLRRAWFLLAMREKQRDRRPLIKRFCYQAITPGEADRAMFALPVWCDFLYYAVRPLRLLLKMLASK
jgi:hypothetical protein